MQKKSLRKGISPLVAAVLLIAITMTIAGMLAYWATGFFRTSLPTNITEIQCTGANFRIYSCLYNSSLNTIDLLLQNTGGVDLSNITAVVIYQNATAQNIFLNGTLPRLQILGYRLSNISQDYSRIVITTICPNIEDTTTCR